MTRHDFDVGIEKDGAGRCAESAGCPLRSGWCAGPARMMAGESRINFRPCVEGSMALLQFAEGLLHRHCCHVASRCAYAHDLGPQHADRLNFQLHNITRLQDSGPTPTRIPLPRFPNRTHHRGRSSLLARHVRSFVKRTNGWSRSGPWTTPLRLLWQSWSMHRDRQFHQESRDRVRGLSRNLFLLPVQAGRPFLETGCLSR